MIRLSAIVNELEKMILEKQNGHQSAILDLNPNRTEWNESRKKLDNFGSASDYAICKSYWVMLENIDFQQNGRRSAIFDLLKL